MRALRHHHHSGRRALLLAVPMLGLLASPAIQTAAADRPSGGTKPVVTCAGVVTGHPGDTYTQTSVQVYKGGRHGTVTITYTCGSDGAWHAS